MIDEGSVGPGAFLDQGDARWAEAQFARPEQVVGPSRNRDRRTYAPSQVADAGVERMARREEEALQRVAETKLLA